MENKYTDKEVAEKLWESRILCTNCKVLECVEMPHRLCSVVEEAAEKFNKVEEYTLKPCPFCGCEYPEERDLVEGAYLYIHCPEEKGGCGASTCTEKLRKEAYDAWNRRA